MNRNDVIDVLSVVAAATRRTVGETDVDVWQAVIGDCDKQLALRAVRDHLREKPGVWLEPGHIYDRVRAIRRDQLEREPAEMREARQEALAAKAAEDIEALAAHKGLPLSAPTIFRRPTANPLTVACPWCKSTPGQHCVIPQTTHRPAEGTHPSRRDAAERASRDALANGRMA